MTRKCVAKRKRRLAEYSAITEDSSLRGSVTVPGKLAGLKAYQTARC